MSSKPTVAELGIDLDAQEWQRSGDSDGAIEVAFVPGAAGCRPRRRRGHRMGADAGGR